MQLTQKETSLLKDLKDQEKLCEEKYKKHAAAASDPQLKNLFSRLAQTEKAHYDMLVQMEQGAVPPPPTGDIFRNLPTCGHPRKAKRLLPLHRPADGGKTCFAPL